MYHLLLCLALVAPILAQSTSPSTSPASQSHSGAEAAPRRSARSPLERRWIRNWANLRKFNEFDPTRHYAPLDPEGSKDFKSRAKKVPLNGPARELAERLHRADKEASREERGPAYAELEPSVNQIRRQRMHEVQVMQLHEKVEKELQEEKPKEVNKGNTLRWTGLLKPKKRTEEKGSEGMASGSDAASAGLRSYHTALSSLSTE